MTSSLLAGIALTAVAGLMSGIFMLPSKGATRWQWGSVWGVYSLFSMVMLPWLLAVVLVRALGAVYAQASLLELAAPFVLGALWGIAQVLFGITVRKLGFAIGYGIVVGLGALLGTIVPMLVQHTVPPQPMRLSMLGAGLLSMIVGIAALGVAGHRRDSTAQGSAPSKAGLPATYLPAFLLAILCGVLAPMLNFAFTAGSALAHRAVGLGTPAVVAAYAVWPIALLGGFVPNAAYSCVLITRERGWSRLPHGGRDVLCSLGMAVLWMGAFALYGMSSVLLGSLGTSVGWALLQICMILTATLAGVLAHEWQGTGGRAIRWLRGGLLSLTAAIVLLAVAVR